jgi:LysM domain
MPFDSLQSVAQAVWGDGSLWYLLAEANGLSAGSTLSAGQGLIIPEKGTNFKNNADTFRPYDAAKAIGDTQPGAPKPPAPKCAAFGAIIMAAIAIAVVTALTAGSGAPLAGAGVASFLGLGASATAVAVGTAIGGGLAG